MMPACRTRPLDVPLEMPFRIAYDTVTHARNVLATVGEDGVVGFGEGAPVPSITGEAQPEVLADPAADPTTLAGRTALDLACWDLLARQDGHSLARALGGAPRPVTTSITLPLVADDELPGLVRRRLAEGWSILKVKAGLDLAQDLRRIALVRGLAGDREVRVDANQGWGLDETVAALPELAEAEVSVLEQPLHKADLDGHAALREASRDVDGPPVMLDESVFGPDDARRALDAGAADWVNIKLQKCGGLTNAVHIADMARAEGVPCMVGCMLETRVGILAAAHLVAAHPNVRKADLDGAALLGADPVVGGGRYDGGRIVLAEEAGIGVTSVAGVTGVAD